MEGGRGERVEEKGGVRTTVWKRGMAKGVEKKVTDRQNEN